MVVVVLMLAALQVPMTAMGQEVNPLSGLVVDTFDDHLDEHDIAFPEPGFNDNTAIVLPNHAFVSEATVNMSFGTFPGTRSAPWDPALDVGSDGIVDWSFDSDRGGPVGLQDRFSDGSLVKEYQFMGEGYREMFINLPRDAHVTEAYLDVEGFPIPHWVTQYTLTPRTDSPGEYGPKMSEYNGEMWVIWQSSDENITTGGDSDVVVRKFDGEKWHRIIELSEAGDTDEDDIPQIIAFGDKLYAIWSKGDGRATAGGHSELVYREYDGTEWGPVTRFSGPKEDGLNTYERCVVYEGRLYVFWKTTDPSYCNHATWPTDRDLDIVYTSFDGDHWAPIVEITDSDNDLEDWSVDVTVFRGLLYVIWDSWDPSITGILGNVDVAYRAFDGSRWTDTINLSPGSDQSLAGGETQDALPRFYVWFNSVTGEEELFAIWMRGRTILPPARGDGYHIVYRRYTGSDWTPMEQLSFAADEPVDQMFPSLVGFNDTLYAIWTVGTNTTSRPEGSTTLIATYGDIIIRSFDGATWSPVLELTPLGNGFDNASHPSILVFDNKLFAAWETPLPTPNDDFSWEIVMRHLEVAPVTIRIEIGEGDVIEWGWERLGNTKRRIHFDPDDITECLQGSPYTQDRFGNKYVELPLRLSDLSAATLKVTNLTIRYDYRVEVDFAGTAEALVSEARDNTHVDKDVPIPFKVSTGQAGTINLEDPRVVYNLDYPPMLIGPVPEQELFEDEARDYLVNLEDYFTDDWDADNLRFTIIEESDPSKVDVYLRDTWLSVHLPEKDWSGEVIVRARAFDRHPFYHNDSNDIVIRVLPVNDPPILDFIPDQELEVDVEHERTLTARDPDTEDNGRLVFTTDSDIVEVSPKGKLRVTFRSFHPRIIYFNVTVTDPAGANDSQEVKYNYTPTRLYIETKDEFPYVLFLLLLLILALVVAERLRRPYRMTEEEQMWDEEAAWEEQERARTSGRWYRRWF